MNNHCVPDFDIQIDDDEDQFPIHISKKTTSRPQDDDEIMELLWQNGPVVMQSQNQRPFRKSPVPATNTGDDFVILAREIRSSQAENYGNHQQHLFTQEDEMVSWLQDSITEDPPFHRQDFCADLLFPPPTVIGGQNHRGVVQPHVHSAELRQPPRPVQAAPRPPIPSARRPKQVANNKTHNFAHFSNHSNVRTELGSSLSSKAAAVQESTVVDSCDTPIATTKLAEASRLSETIRSSTETGRGGSMSSAGKAGTSAGGRETTTCDMTVTSSPGCSSGSAEPVQRETAVDRKRKGREAEESEFQSEDADFESLKAKKKVRGSTSIKRSRAAEVHNLSERRRRDRINEKMKALQELIPRCNKSDKASMLDEAIEYLKSLQLQVQMMSMGCGMVPMMFPGIQQYMPGMGMGIGMGMGMEMGMGMGMNRQVMPFPNMLAGSALPAATAAAHLGPRFAMPPFNMPHVPAAPDSSRMQVASQPDNMLNSLGTMAPDQSRITNPNFTDPYQQYLSPHQMQLQLMQPMNQPNVSKPSTSGGQENPQKHQSEKT